MAPGLIDRRLFRPLRLASLAKAHHMAPV